jgi:hypothetical protein
VRVLVVGFVGDFSRVFSADIPV